jgi:preprotein translocase subunit YajC
MSLISPAYAQGGGAPGPGGGFDLILIVVMMVVFYFLLIRPQQKRAKEHRELINNLNKGDEVVTAGGILGKIVKVTEDDFVVVEIANQLEIKLQKQSIQATLPKGTIKSI